MRVKAVVVLALLFLANVAWAETFNLTAIGTSPATITLSATLTGQACGGAGFFCLTSIAGNVNGQAIGAILPTSPLGTVTNSPVVNSWYITYDNVLNMNKPFFDYYGLGFTMADGSLVNVYYDSGYWYAKLGQNPPTPWETVNVSVAAVPEPASLLLLGSGLVALGASLRKRLL